jgi:DNA-binding IclR family transcriptional regulator
METTPETPLKSTTTTLEIIDQIREHNELGVTETAELLGVPKSTASDHLRTLRQHGYLVKRDRKYALGLRFLQLGDHARNNHEIYSAGKPNVDSLASDTGELVHLSLTENGKGVIIYEKEGDQAVSLDTFIGRRVSLHCTALGQAMLSRMPRREVLSIIEDRGIPAATPETITDEDVLFERLAAVADRGYAIVQGERIPELGCIAAPVGSNEYGLGAISVCCPMSRADDNRFEQDLPQQLVEAANRINLDLKYS